MRADRREEDEQRRPRRPAHLERIEAIERELIGDGEPAELRSAIRQPIGAVDFIEAVEAPFRPALSKSGHERDRPEPVAAERSRERIAVLHHQQRVRVLIADLDP